jgi:hypothetical protein
VIRRADVLRWSVILSPKAFVWQMDNLEFRVLQAPQDFASHMDDMHWAASLLGNTEPFVTLGRTAEQFEKTFTTREGYLFVVALVDGERAGGEGFTIHDCALLTLTTMQSPTFDRLVLHQLHIW